MENQSPLRQRQRSSMALEALPYVEWMKVKASHKLSTEDRDFLANRVKRLQDEQRSLEAHINNARERITTVEEARHAISTDREEKERRRRAEAEALAQKQLEIAQRRKQLSAGIAAARAASARSRSERRAAILKMETDLERSASARRRDEAAMLSDRCSAIAKMKKQCVETRSVFLDERRQKLQLEHARNGTLIVQEQTANVKTAASLVVLEANLLRNIVELRREFRREGQRLATLVTPRPPASSPPSDRPQRGGPSATDGVDFNDDDHE
jgi:hypothetical protein